MVKSYLVHIHCHTFMQTCEQLKYIQHYTHVQTYTCCTPQVVCTLFPAFYSNSERALEQFSEFSMWRLVRSPVCVYICAFCPWMCTDALIHLTLETLGETLLYVEGFVRPQTFFSPVQPIEIHLHTKFNVSCNPNLRGQ